MIWFDQWNVNTNVNIGLVKSLFVFFYKVALVVLSCL